MSGEELQPLEAKAVARALTAFCNAVSNSLKASHRSSSSGGGASSSSSSKTSLVSRICGLRPLSSSSSSSSSSCPFAETQVRALMVRARLRREEALQALMLEQAIEQLPHTWTPAKKLEVLTARCAACTESRHEYDEYDDSRKPLKRRVVNAADSAGGANKDSTASSKQSLKDIEESRGFGRRRRTKKNKLFGVAES